MKKLYGRLKDFKNVVMKVWFIEYEGDKTFAERLEICMEQLDKQSRTITAEQAKNILKEREIDTEIDKARRVKQSYSISFY